MQHAQWVLLLTALILDDGPPAASAKFIPPTESSISAYNANLPTGICFGPAMFYQQNPDGSITPARSFDSLDPFADPNDTVGDPALHFRLQAD
jgi:hypothetical protein